MPNEAKAAVEKATKEAHVPHLIVDGDCWFSCPLSGECCNDEEPERCNCGADERNAAIQSALAAVRWEALQQAGDVVADSDTLWKMIDAARRAHEEGSRA
jgi:hypothetical protein